MSENIRNIIILILILGLIALMFIAGAIVIAIGIVAFLVILAWHKIRKYILGNKYSDDEDTLVVDVEYEIITEDDEKDSK